MNIDIWSVLICIFIFQGLFFLISLLISSKRRKKEENKYLIFIIVVLLWYLTEFLSVRNIFDVKINLFYGTRYGSWFLLGPLLFFYFKSITNSKWKFSKKEFFHFIPFIAFVLIIPLFFDGILNRRQVSYGMLSVFDHREKIISPMQYVYSTIFILQFLHLGYYLYKNLKIIKLYSNGLASEYASLESNVKWLKILNRTLLGVLLFSVIFLYILLVTDIYRRHLDYIYVLPIGFLFYIIGYHLMNVEWKEVDKKVLKYANSTLNEHDVTKYTQKLDFLMENQKVYLNQEIRLNNIADEIGMKRHHLSQLINQYYKQSFFDYINKYRVLEAKKAIANDPEQPLIQIAFDTGFNNKTSFINAFKKFEKTTPSKFREEVLRS